MNLGRAKALGPWGPGLLGRLSNPKIPEPPPPEDMPFRNGREVASRRGNLLKLTASRNETHFQGASVMRGGYPSVDFGNAGGVPLVKFSESPRSPVDVFSKVRGAPRTHTHARSPAGHARPELPAAVPSVPDGWTWWGHGEAASREFVSFCDSDAVRAPFLAPQHLKG